MWPGSSALKQQQHVHTSYTKKLGAGYIW